MKEDAFSSFLDLSERDRRDAFAVAVCRLDTVPSYVERYFCLVLDALFTWPSEASVQGWHFALQCIRSDPAVLGGH